MTSHVAWQRLTRFEPSPDLVHTLTRAMTSVLDQTVSQSMPREASTPARSLCVQSSLLAVYTFMHLVGQENYVGPPIPHLVVGNP